jgi:hypothetical protein
MCENQANASGQRHFESHTDNGLIERERESESESVREMIE